MPRALLILAAALVALAMGVRYRARHFTDAELRGHADELAPDLLAKLDAFREQWGARVFVSPARGAIVRRIEAGEPGYDSQHNATRWGESRAVDVFPEGMTTAADMERAVRIAREVGFTGIGLYPDTERDGDAGAEPMMHLDVRRDRAPGDPATWGDLDTATGTVGSLGLAAVLASVRQREAAA